MARGWKKFKRQLRHSARAAAPILKAASSIASVVPGAGTAVAAGLGAAAAAARGEKIANVLGAGLTNAIPGVSQASTALDAARALGVGRGMRALRSPDPARSLTRHPALRTTGRATDQLAREILRRSPGLVALAPGEIARRTGLSTQAVTRVLQSGPPLAWRPLSSQAARMVQRLSSVVPAHFSRDVAGLSTDGLTYTVESGDYPYKIASKLTGDANRWRELVSANPQKKRDAKTGNFATLYAGEVLTLPGSWVKPVSSPTLSTAVVLKSKGILAAWSKTDGASSPGLTDYGLRPEDVTPSWTERDRLALKGFEFWAKMADQSGALTQAAADALTAWAEHKAGVPAPSLPAPTVSLPPDVVTVPRLPAPTGPVSMPNEVPPPVGTARPTIPSLPEPSTTPASLPQLPPATSLPELPAPSLPAPSPTAANDGAPPGAVGTTSGGTGAGTVLGILAAAAAALML